MTVNAEGTQNIEIDDAKTGQEAVADGGGQQEAPKTVDPPAGDAGGEKKDGEQAAPKTALEAAKRVMAQEAKSAPEPAKTEKADAKPEDAEKPKDGAAAEDDDSKLPFKDHPKWKEISSQNRILKVAKEKNEAAIKELEPKAKTHDDLAAYLSENRLSRDDFTNMLAIGAAMRNDPMRAYEMLLPIVERLESVVGVRLPADLQAQVASGQVTQEVAAELARTRAEKAVADDRRKRAEEDAQAARARETQSAEERAEGELVATFNTWQQEWKGRDPDYAKKLPIVMRTLEAAWGRGEIPSSQEGCRQQAEDALKEVNKYLSGILQPAPKPKTGGLPLGGSTTTARPIPQSSLEAAKAALGANG